jgi:hypothetical protein
VASGAIPESLPCLTTGVRARVTHEKRERAYRAFLKNNTNPDGLSRKLSIFLVPLPALDRALRRPRERRAISLPNSVLLKKGAPRESLSVVMRVGGTYSHRARWPGTARTPDRRPSFKRLRKLLE